MKLCRIPTSLNIEDVECHATTVYQYLYCFIKLLKGLQVTAVPYCAEHKT